MILIAVIAFVVVRFLAVLLFPGILFAGTRRPEFPPQEKQGQHYGEVNQDMLYAPAHFRRGIGKRPKRSDRRCPS